MFIEKKSLGFINPLCIERVYDEDGITRVKMSSGEIFDARDSTPKSFIESIDNALIKKNLQSFIDKLD